MLKKLLYSSNFWFYNYILTFIMLSFFIIEPLRKRIEERSTLTSYSDAIFLLSVLILILSLFFYIKSYQQIKKNEIDKKKLKLFFLIFSFLLIFIWPITSHDAFSYIYQSRIISHHQANPYEHSYSEFKYNDKLYNILENKWSSRYSPYGPLFLNIGSGITKIANNNLIISLLLFKLVFWLFFIGSAGLVYKITKSLSSFYLFAFNPYLLFEFLINGHNDIIIIFFLLLSLYYLFKTSWKTQFLSITFLFLAFITKSYAIIFLPLAGIKIILNKKLITEKVKIFIFFLFFIILSTLFSIFLIDKNVNLKTLLLPIQNQTNIINPVLHSPFIGIIKNIFKTSWKDSALISQTIFIIIFSALSLFLSQKYKYRQLLNYHIFIWVLATIFFFLTCIPWFMPWYLTIIISLLILLTHNNTDVKQKIFLYSLYFISFFAIIFYIILR